MKFDTPATTNPIDQLKVVGKPHRPHRWAALKTTGTAPYAYERHDVAPNAAYGYRGRRGHRQGPHRLDRSGRREARPACWRVVTADNAGKLGKGKFNTAQLLGGPEIEHYHQAVALVVAETFEQARAAAQLVQVHYRRGRRAPSISRRPRTAPASRTNRRRAATRAVGDFAERLRRARRCSSTRPTPRPTSRTR